MVCLSERAGSQGRSRQGLGLAVPSPGALPVHFACLPCPALPHVLQSGEVAPSLSRPLPPSHITRLPPPPPSPHAAGLPGPLSHPLSKQPAPGSGGGAPPDRHVEGAGGPGGQGTGCCAPRLESPAWVASSLQNKALAAALHALKALPAAGWPPAFRQGTGCCAPRLEGPAWVASRNCSLCWDLWPLPGG